MSVPTNLVFDPRHGEPVSVGPAISRITASNEGPMTFRGTNSYLVGTRSVAVIDPGPMDERHLSALIAAIAGRPVEAILLTHGHRDHSDLAPRLRQAVGAPVMAAETYRGHIDEPLGDGRTLTVGGSTIEVVATPGHCGDHLCFALPQASILFSGDHVMAWSTTVIAPPDGRLADYMASLDKLMDRTEARYLPGHGGAVEQPQTMLRALRTHRRMRETAIVARLASGRANVGSIVSDLYRHLDPALVPAASLSVQAHLDDLLARGLIVTTNGAYEIASTPPA